MKLQHSGCAPLSNVRDAHRETDTETERDRERQRERERETERAPIH